MASQPQKQQPPQPPAVKPSPLAGRTRSPNYPSINLRTAVTRARAVLQKMKRYPTSPDVLAKVWGQSHKSSTFKLNLAAMRSFGLLDDHPNGKDTLVKLSNLALDIIADYAEGSPQQQEAIRKAALTPKIHKELHAKYGPTLPADEEVRRYLVREREPAFNDNTVGDFIAEYKATMAFANMVGGDKITDDQKEETPPAPSLGDLVQWSPSGVDQFQELRKVMGLSPDGLFAFVEGNPTGLPVSELTVQKQKADPQVEQQPPPNPFYGSSSRRAEDVGPVIHFPLQNGNAVEIRLRSKVSKSEFETVKALLALSQASLVDPEKK